LRLLSASPQVHALPRQEPQQIQQGEAQSPAPGEGQGQAPAHRITGCFGLEGTFRDHTAQPPCSKQGHLQLVQVVQSPVQPDFECFWGWGLCYLSVQSVPVFHHLIVKNFFLLSSLNLPFLGFKPLVLVLSQQDSLKKLCPSFLQAPFKY